MRGYWALLTGTAVVVLTAAACAPSALAASRPQTRTHPLIPAAPPSRATGVPATGHSPLLIPTISYNWSGLDDSADGPFSSVTATWTEPPIRPAGPAFTDVAFWVGLDGDNSDTVEQIGTEGYSQGAVGYDAWFEMYPAEPVTVDLSIRPGDVVTGSVVETGVATFTLSLVDHTSGKSFQTTQSLTVPPALASAEVVAEAPTDYSDNVVALGQFGLVQFTDCAFNGRPIGSYDLNQIDMASYYSDKLADRTLALSADGTGFAVTTDVTAPTTQVVGAASVWHDRAQTVHFTATDNDGGQGVAYTEYSFDGGATWTTGAAATVAAPADHSADGVHRVLYRSVDNVGNVEARRVCRVFIDTQPPRPVANWRATARRGSDAVLRYVIADHRPGSPTATATIRVTNARGALVKKAVLPAVRVGTPQTWEFVCRLPKGTYRFTVTATDAAGNRAATAAANTLVVR